VIANYERELKIVVDIKRKEKVEKVTEFVSQNKLLTDCDT